MSAIYILVIASLSVALCFLAAFVWSVRNGQYEDDYTPSVRMLFDNEVVKHTEEKSNSFKGNFDQEPINKTNQ